MIKIGNQFCQLIFAFYGRGEMDWSCSARPTFHETFLLCSPRQIANLRYVQWNPENSPSSARIPYSGGRES